jgi:hypothetical protein
MSYDHAIIRNVREPRNMLQPVMPLILRYAFKEVPEDVREVSFTRPSSLTKLLNVEFGIPNPTMDTIVHSCDREGITVLNIRDSAQPESNILYPIASPVETHVLKVKVRQVPAHQTVTKKKPMVSSKILVWSIFGIALLGSFGFTWKHIHRIHGLGLAVVSSPSKISAPHAVAMGSTGNSSVISMLHTDPQKVYSVDHKSYVLPSVNTVVAVKPPVADITHASPHSSGTLVTLPVPVKNAITAAQPPVGVADANHASTHSSSLPVPDEASSSALEAPFSKTPTISEPPNLPNTPITSQSVAPEKKDAICKVETLTLPPLPPLPTTASVSQDKRNQHSSGRT